MVMSPSRLNYDRLGVRLNRLCVDAVGKPFLDDDGVGVIIFPSAKAGRKSSRTCPRRSCPAKPRVVATDCPPNRKRFLSRPDFGSAFVNRFRRIEVAGERRSNRQHIGDVTVLAVNFFARCICSTSSPARSDKIIFWKCWAACFPHTAPSSWS